MVGNARSNHMWRRKIGDGRGQKGEGRRRLAGNKETMR
jgi:hypothetical protein